MAKSVHVSNNVLYPYPNMMVIERTYHYIAGFDANRKPVRMPKNFRIGWTRIATVKDDYIKMGTFESWTVREIYVKNGHIYNYGK